MSCSPVSVAVRGGHGAGVGLRAREHGQREQRGHGGGRGGERRGQPRQPRPRLRRPRHGRERGRDRDQARPSLGQPVAEVRAVAVQPAGAHARRLRGVRSATIQPSILQSRQYWLWSIYFGVDIENVI